MVLCHLEVFQIFLESGIFVLKFPNKKTAQFSIFAYDFIDGIMKLMTLSKTQGMYTITHKYKCHCLRLEDFSSCVLGSYQTLNGKEKK